MLFVQKIKNYFINHKWLLSILSGLLLAGSYPPSFLWILAFVSFVPLFWFLDKAKNKRESFLGGYILGLVYFGLTIRWIFASLPLEWMNISNSIAGAFIIGFIWLVITLIMALAGGFFALFIKIFPEKYKLIIVPSLWIILEFLNAFVFGWIWIGPESAIGPFWQYGNLGFIFSKIPFALYLAGAFGVYGASWIIIFINRAIYEISLKPKDKKIIFSIFADLALFLSIPLWLMVIEKDNIEIIQKTEEKNIAVVQTNATYHTSLWEGHDGSISAKSIKALKENLPNVDLVVVPEGGFLFGKNFEQTKKEYKNIFGEKQVEVVSNLQPELTPGPVLSVKLNSSSGDIKIIGEKEVLAAFGEYMPFLIKKISKLFLEDHWFAAYTMDRPFTKGNKFYFQDSKEVAFICTPIFSSELWRRAASEGAEIFMISANQWFFAWPSLFGQGEASLRFFAAQNHRFLAFAVNGGYSFIVDPDGKIIAKSKDLKDLVLSSKVAYYKGNTLTSKIGEWTIVFSILFILIVVLKECWNQFLKIKIWKKKNQ